MKWPDETMEVVATSIYLASPANRAANALAAIAQCKEVRAKDAALIKARDALEWVVTHDSYGHDLPAKALTAINEVLL